MPEAQKNPSFLLEFSLCHRASKATPGAVPPQDRGHKTRDRLKCIFQQVRRTIASSPDLFQVSQGRSLLYAFGAQGRQQWYQKWLRVLKSKSGDQSPVSPSGLVITSPNSLPVLPPTSTLSCPLAVPRA